jgi:hypothetical protein
MIFNTVGNGLVFIPLSGVLFSSIGSGIGVSSGSYSMTDLLSPDDGGSCFCH